MLIFVLALFGGTFASGASGAARFYTPDYGSKTPEEIGGFDLGADGSLTPIPGSPFPAEKPPLGGLWGLAFSPDGTRAMTGFYFTGGVQSYTVPPNGIFQLAGSAIPTASATSVAITPDGRYAFASTREFGGMPAEGIRRFAFNPDGSLAPLTPSAGSGEYADIAISPDGRFLFATTGSAIQRFAIGADGALTPLGSTPLPGAFFLAAAGDPGRLFAFVVSGGSNGVASFAIEADGGLSQSGATAALGTASFKLFAASPDGRYIFVADYYNNKILTVAIAADGVPSLRPGGLPVERPESVGVSPDGRFLIFYLGGGSENQLGTAAINADGSLTDLPFGTPWSSGEPERIVFQPQPAPVARFDFVAGVTGQPTRFDATGSTGAARFEWDFGDGTKLADGGPTPTHAYAQAGSFTVTLKTFDRNGCSSGHVYNGQSTVCPGGAATATARTIEIAAPGGKAPVLGKVKAVPKKFFAKPKPKAKGKFGTTFRYGVSEPATVRFKIERKTVGRLVGRKCKPLTAKNAAGKQCLIFKREGSRSQKAKAGANKLKWDGRLKGSPLPAGSYRAIVVATNAAGGRSAPKTVGFRILPPPKQP
jgi:6-phosphogluconolactonase (cycloisomerase 2 family)